ncbi:MAG TPA: hypothetical protein PKD72_10295, partial [Gemmatales bacterium]|nr:hypothetical protein [Gemmatales bacterium]
MVRTGAKPINRWRYSKPILETLEDRTLPSATLGPRLKLDEHRQPPMAEYQGYQGSWVVSLTPGQS